MEITRVNSDSRFPLELKHPNGGTMLLDPTRLLLAFGKPHTREQIQGRLLEFDLVLEDAFESEKKTAELQRKKLTVINHTNQRYWVRSHDGNPITPDRINLLETKFKDILEWIGPVYRLANIEGREGLFCPLPDVLVVKPVAHLKEAESKALSSTLEEFGLLEVKEKSKYLSGLRFCNVAEPRKHPSFEIRKRLEKNPKLFRSSHFDNMPMVRPTAVTPTDPLFVEQWDMTRIQAPEGWNISTGTSTVVVCILDEGVDLTHPDLLPFSDAGINLGTMLPDGSPTGNHGTACAGIVAARFNNALGPAGVAGNCQILPLAFQNWTDTEVASGINYAADHGARVISMSFGWNAWDHAIIDPAIQHAFDLDVVMCVATHNYNGAITYPATNPLVMAVGASDEIDNRKTPSSPDGESWGSDFGPEISVVAPGVHIPTTDRQGSAGYNTASGTAGNYIVTFNGTSSATPHVAGLAALLRSTYPALTNLEVRRIIERTADKVGAVPYANASGHPNGTWNQEMGYGRINVFHALDFADVMIKDNPSDTGAEPSFGEYWKTCDLVVRPTDDNVFIPTDPLESDVERGHTNYIYVRVTNNGPADARNVVVNTRIVEFPAVHLIYPDDWTLIDSVHVSPSPVTAAFATIPAGTSVIAKFTISPAQVDELWDWQSGHFKVCLLAEVRAENDYAFAPASFTGGGMVMRSNNLAQRNLTVIEAPAGATVRFPFVLGNIKSPDDFVELVIDRGLLPRTSELLLSLEEHPEVFPKARFEDEADNTGFRKPGLVFLDRTRVETTLGPHRGVLVLEKGSRFDGVLTSKLSTIKVTGGEIIERDGARFVRIDGRSAVVRAAKLPKTSLPLMLETKLPATAKRGETFEITLAQRNTQGETISGASVMFVVK